MLRALDVTVVVVHGQPVHGAGAVGPAVMPAACGFGEGSAGSVPGAWQTPSTSAAAAVVVVTTGLPVGTPPVVGVVETVVVSVNCTFLPAAGVQIVAV